MVRSNQLSLYFILQRRIDFRAKDFSGSSALYITKKKLAKSCGAKVPEMKPDDEKSLSSDQEAIIPLLSEFAVKKSVDCDGTENDHPVTSKHVRAFLFGMAGQITDSEDGSDTEDSEISDSDTEEEQMVMHEEETAESKNSENFLDSGYDSCKQSAA